MTCYSPIVGYRAKYVNPKTGKRPIVFKRDQGYVDMPVELPCGRCIGCRLDYSRDWAVRCVHEASMHQENMFLTLTYNDDHLPDDRSISVREMQLFLKRYRKHTDKKIKYFACGEYGGEYGRAHYHALIFGDRMTDLKLHTINKNGDNIYRSEILNKIWGKGFTWIGEVTFQSAAYVARYVMKKLTGEKSNKLCEEKTGEIYDVKAPFVIMSKKSPIGKEWYDKYKTDTDKDFVTVDRKKFRLPKYYDTLMDEQDLLDRKAQRVIEANERRQTRERLKTIEKVKTKQISHLKRDKA
jgi:hypothetical protein